MSSRPAQTSQSTTSSNPAESKAATTSPAKSNNEKPGVAPEKEAEKPAAKNTNGADPPVADDSIRKPDGNIENKSPISSLLPPTFALKILEWDIEGGPDDGTGAMTSRATLLSKQLGVSSPGALTLVQLRQKLAAIPSMSSSRRIHVFCTDSGETVSDETTTFEEYLQLQPMTAAPNSKLSSVNVVYKRAFAANEPQVATAPQVTPMQNVEAVDKVARLDELGTREQASLIDDTILKPKSGSSERDSPAFLTHAQWSFVFQNCALMYGWIVDKENNRITQAPRPAFQLKTTPLKSVILTNDNNKADKTDLVNGGVNIESIKVDNADSQEGTPSEDRVVLIPFFKVNDNSHIEVTVASHELETSMARNDFSSHSTEANASGGFAGITVSVSAGYAESKSSGSKASTRDFKKTMVASYLFPRADITIHPNDIEPSPELAAALRDIAKYKNIKDLRKLYQDFGHVFCRQVTIGGRLQAIKIMEDESQASEQEQKERMKWSVGIQVNTPFGGGGFKHEEEKGSSSSSARREESQREQNVFEAVGGDTILASEPEAWIPTVAKYWNWRVIQRDNLSTLVKLISELPGFSGLQTLFMQAVPTLSKFVEFPDTHEFKSRLRLVSVRDSLSRSFLDQTKGTVRFDDPVYYLGHIPNRSVFPRYMGLKSAMRDFWGEMVKYPDEPPMFTPSGYRAPGILGYPSDKINAASLTYGQDILNSVWSITAPYNDSLQHGCKVYLTNVTQEQIIEAPEAVKFTPVPGAPTPPPKPAPRVEAVPPCSMMVFRNQQGVFLPGMSSTDDHQFWRIIKVGASRMGENIREGDTVRLGWAFADQMGGYRDFVDDVYGRHRLQCPPELESQVLYPKLPWPRFEPIEDDGEPVGMNAMVMSTSTGQEDVWNDIVSRSQLKRSPNGSSPYIMQDLTFRLDPVLNDGHGDSDDYLLDNKDAPAPTPLEIQELLQRRILGLEATNSALTLSARQERDRYTALRRAVPWVR